MATNETSSPVESCFGADEATRLAALRDLSILETPPEESFDVITRLAAKALQVPILLMSLADENRQWFKSRVGLDVTQTPREISFCTHTLSGREPLLVCDTLLDSRFASNPLVVNEPHIRAYLGVPLFTRAGHTIGTLCAIDRRPRDFGAEQVATLSGYAKLVEVILHSREFHAGLERAIATHTAALRAERAERERIMESHSQLIAVIESSDEAIIGKTPNGVVTSWNRGAEKLFGYTREEAIGRKLLMIFPPDRLTEESRILDRVAKGERIDNFETVRVRKDGKQLDVVVTISPIEDSTGRIVGISNIARDISRRKDTEAQLRESHERLRLLIDHAPACMAMFDRQMRYIAVSRRWLDDHFRGDLDLLGRSHYEVFPEIPDSWKAVHARAMAGEVVRAQEEPFTRIDGSAAWQNWEVRPWRASDGSVGGIVIFAQDITELKVAADELRIAAVALESQEGIVISDKDGLILRVNKAFSVLTGFDAQEIIGTPVRALLDVRQDPAAIEELSRQIRGAGYWQGELWTKRKLGGPFIARRTISAVRTESGEITNFVGSFSDITGAKRAEEQIHTLAYFDALTQLPNRRLLYDRMTQVMADNRRSRALSAALFLDLDNFKVLNDTRGHNVGDGLLVTAAQRIQANVRGHDTVARLGGDEFVVIISDLGEDVRAAATHAGAVGEKLREALARPYDVDGRQYHCPASLGIALFRGAEETIETVLKHADLAMYQAKSAGRNTVRFFDPAMQIALDRRSALESDLRLAVELGQLRLHYQPQLNREGRIIGAEALLRWVHHEHGVIMPGDFIGLAEESGLILSIGEWVLQCGCAQLVAWSRNAATRDLQLAVNVSALQFHRPEFVALAANAVAQAGAEPTRLTIEITESVVLNDVADTLTKMEQLKALGIRLSLDDFGTGNSSLSYLSRLPLNELKIDKSFVVNLPDNRNDAIIVQTIITMATSLGLNVIAEGVETEAQRAFLQLHGCNSHQGYLYSPPLPSQEFDRFVTLRAQSDRKTDPAVTA
jgi:diguanylate cyclase (GGDEF)-like protein/PAS domain S-box-containing protein